MPEVRSSPDNQNALPDQCRSLTARSGTWAVRPEAPTVEAALGQRIDPGGVEFGEGPARKIIGAAAGSDEVGIGIGRAFIART
jgi:hypothetical protein